MSEQSVLWNGAAGHAWVDEQALLDRMYAPFADLLAEAVASRPAKGVLDVGCGTGGTILEIARRLGAPGTCVGIDISGPMIDAARARAERDAMPVSFIRADAQTHAFAPASFDAIVSRFGVMFFDDPVRAFTNLRQAATWDAELRCIAWRSAGDNPFMTAAERAAAPLLPDLPARRPDAPGQFSFEDERRVHDILERSGWTGIDLRPIDVACTFPEPALVSYLTRLGPVGRALQDVDDRTRARVIDTIRPAFDAFVHGTEVRFTAACWMIGARPGAHP